MRSPRFTCKTNHQFIATAKMQSTINLERLIAEVEQQHLEMAAVVRVDHAGAHVDEVLDRKA